MKIRIIIIFFLIKMNMFCQSGSLTGSNNQISTQIPVLSPQSPTTGELGKYGEVLVNESTGVISPAVQIFDFIAGKMKLPIALNYSGNSVKVLQDPSWTGINWNLNPGGIITRVVKDRPDEITPNNNRLYYKSSELNSFAGAWTYYGSKYSTTTEWYGKVYALNNNTVDSEVDIFTYNFLGYSGSFYLDYNFNVHLIKYDKELEITFNYFANNKSSFRIKTPDGNNYYFGGPNASESSKTCTINGAGSCSTAFSLPYSQNAFYISQIAFLNGGTVNFEYTQNGSNICQYKIGVQESATMLTGAPSPTCDITSPLLINSLVENTVTLKKINSSMTNLFVDFETSIINKCASIYKLNNIYLKSKSSTGVETLIKKIKLSYLTPLIETVQSRNKFFLEKVEFFDSQNQFINKYDLTYDSLNLIPKKDSNAQDELGIYNGKDTNTQLLPLTDYAFLNSACYRLADREAFLNYSKVGSLTKIKYPTGGFSEFEYELPYKGKKQLILNHNFTVTAAPVGSGYISSPSLPNGNITVYNSYYYPDGGDGNLIVPQTVDIKATLYANLIGLFTHQNKIAIWGIKTLSGGSSQEFLIGEYGNFPTTGGNTSMDFNYTLQPGTYSFKLVINKYQAGINNIILGGVDLKLPDSFRDVYYPGLRVKRIKSFTNDGDSMPDIKRYYYNKVSQLNQEAYVFNPNYLYITKSSDNIIYNLSANSVLNTFNNDLGKYVYEYVTVSNGGDTFENGGKEMKFYKDGNQGATEYVVFDQVGSSSSGISYSDFVDVGTNQSYQNSILAEETLYNNNLTKLKSTSYNYQSAQIDFIGNMKIFSYTANGNIFLYYETKSYQHRLISTITKDFLNGIANPIESTIIRNYSSNRVSLPSSIEATNSLNETIKTNIFYKNDFNLSLPEFGALTTFDISRLPTSEIVKTENFLNTELIGTKQISFKNFSGNVLPNIIKDKKSNIVGTNTDERIVFETYDPYGYPSLVSKKDGGKIRYIYNGKQQVILKIEENTAGLLLDDSITSTNPCYYQETYPSSMITVYNYDPITNNLISIIDSKCDKITYEYDTFNRLKSIKDKNGTLLSENDYHYKN